MKPVILVVDDDSAICELLGDVLSAHVFDVLVCQTGGEALAVAAQRRAAAGYGGAGGDRSRLPDVELLRKPFTRAQLQ